MLKLFLLLSWLLLDIYMIRKNLPVYKASLFDKLILISPHASNDYKAKIDLLPKSPIANDKK